MIDQATKNDILGDLASGISQGKIAQKHPAISQQSISYLKRQNTHAIEQLRTKLIDKLSSKYISRAIREEDKAGSIIDALDGDALPSQIQERYLSRVDKKHGGLVKSVVAPHTADTNISLTKNETTTNIIPEVLRMFQQGAGNLLHDADISSGHEETALPGG